MASTESHPPLTAFDLSATLTSARQTLELEAQAILALKQRLSEDFVRAVELMLACKGRVVVCGLGKTGHIARKIASTLASTGTPSFFSSTPSSPSRPTSLAVDVLWSLLRPQ